MGWFVRVPGEAVVLTGEDPLQVADYRFAGRVPRGGIVHEHAEYDADKRFGHLAPDERARDVSQGYGFPLDRGG